MRSARSVLLTVVLAASAVACDSASGPTAIEIPIGRLEFVQVCPFVETGAQCALVVRAFTPEGQQIGNPVLRWASSNSSSVAIVEEDGTSAVVRGNAPGNSTIIVSNTTNTVSARTQVRVAGASK